MDFDAVVVRGVAAPVQEADTGSPCDSLAGRQRS